MNVGTVVVDAVVDGDGSGVSAIQLVTSRLNSVSRVIKYLVFIVKAHPVRSIGNGYLRRNSAGCLSLTPSRRLLHSLGRADFFYDPVGPVTVAGQFIVQLPVLFRVPIPRDSTAIQDHLFPDACDHLP